MKYNNDYKSRFKILKKGKIALCISAITSSILMADVSPTALPANPNVVNGNVVIQTNNSNMTINQSSNQGVINWGSFNIGSASSVRFNQPNTNSSTLNRIVGGEMSQIAGNLSANGNIILINPNGVMFQNNSRVDVGGIIATTMNLKDSDYLNNNYTFTRDGSVGKIINSGNITAKDEGYIALLAPEIANEGVVTAKKGTIAFSAGDKVVLDFNGNNLVNIEVDSATIDTNIANKNLVQADGGLVYMSSKVASNAISSTISNTGTIQANAIEEKDGKIILFAHEGTTNVDGKIEAKDGFVETSGSKVNISDNLTVKARKMLIDPKNITITSSNNIALDSNGLGYGTNPSADSTITNTQVQTILNGATNLTLQANNDITVSSAISVNNSSGNGGILSLSAGRSVYINASITTDDGNLNIFANDTLANGVNDSYRDSGTAVISMSSGQSINAGSGIVTMDLRNGAGKTYTAAGDITLYGITAGGLNIQNNMGNIAINGNIAKISGTDNSAIFKATSNVVIANGASITSTLNKLNTTFWSDSDASNGGAIVLNGSNTITSNGGNITLAGGVDSNSDSIPDGYAIGNATYNNGVLIQQTSNVTSNGGNILIKGKSYTSGIANGIYIDNQTSTNTISSSSGNITIDGIGQSTSGDSSGIRLGYDVPTSSTDYTGNLKIQSTTGSISLIGTGSTNGNGTVSGVDIRGVKVSIFSTSNGSITITGTGGTSSSSTATTNAAGVIMTSGAILSQSGVITINGTVGTGGDANKRYAIYIGGSLGAAASYDVTSSSSNIILNGDSVMAGAGSITYMSGYNASNLIGATATTNTSIANGQTSGSWAITVPATTTSSAGWGGGSDGSGWFTSDSYVYGAAVYAGVIANGSSGIIYVQSGPAQSSYIGGTRNGVSSSSYGSFGSSYKIMAASGGSPKITTTGSVTIQPMGNTFSSAFDTGVFEYSGISALNIGKSTNTAGVTISKDIAIAGTSNNNAVSITGGTITVNKTINATAGNIVINANSLIMDASYGKFQSTGKLNIAPNSSSTTIGIAGAQGTFTIPQSYFSTNFVNGFSEIVIGKSTQTGKIKVGTLSSNDNLTLQNTVGGIEITGTISMSSNNLTLNSSGTIIDIGSGYISSTGGLLLLGGGSVTLANTSNNFTTLAANTGAITLVESNGFSVGTISSVNGITSTGLVNLLTSSGDIAITKNISTTDNTSSAIILNAGKNTSAGTSGGGNITVSNSSTITVGTGGRSILYTGSVSGSTGLTTMIGSGSGRFRYNSDEISTGYDTTFAPLGAGNYAIYRERPTISASTASPTISYGDALPSLPLTLSSAQNGDTVSQVFKTMPTVTVGGTNNSDGYRNVGSYTISATGGAEGLGYYLSGISGTGTLTVAKKVLTISGLELNDKVYNNSTSSTTMASYGTLNGFIGSDNLSKVYLNNSGYTVGTFSGANVGTYSVSVSGLSLSGTSASNYQLSSSSFTDSSVQITPATLTLATAINLTDRIYNGTNSATTIASYSSLSGVASGDSSYVSLTGGTVGQFSGVNAGTYSVEVTGLSLTGSKASNYILSTTSSTDSNVSITKKNITITGLSSINKIYDGTTNLPSGSYYNVTGLVGSDTLITTGNGIYNSKDTGNRTITQGTLALSGDSATNYSMSWSNGSGTISKATLTMTANDTMKVITDTDPLFSAKYSGFVNGETSSVLSTTSFSRTVGEGAGTYTITPSGTALNYTITSVIGILTIQPADTLVVQLNNATSTYGSNPTSLTAVTTAKYYSSTLQQLKSFTLTNSGGTYSGSDGMGATISFTPSTLASSTSDVGNYDIGATVSLTGSQNYNTALVQKGVLTINPLQVTLNASTITKTYDGLTSVTSSNPISITNLKNSDSVTIVGSGVYNSKDVSSASSYIYSNLSLSGAKANNYALSSTLIANGITGVGTITSKSITVSATASDKIYDRTDIAEIGLSSSGIISGDSVIFSGTGAFSNVNVGTQTVNVTGISKSGLDAGNYTLSSTTASTSALITPKTITFIGIGIDKEYDGQTTTIVNTALSGVILGDSVTASYTSALFDNKNAGFNKTITVNGLSLNNANYSISSIGTAFGSITPKTLTISAVTQTKTYDGSTISTAAPTSSGLVSGDTLSNLSQSFTNKDVSGMNGSTLSVNSTYLLSDGNNGANYTVVTNTATGTINKKALTMSINNDAKIITDIDPTLTASYSGFVAGENNSVISENISRNTGESAGTYTILAAPIANNYDITVNNGIFTIVAADTLLVKLSNITSVYGDTPTYAVDSAKYYFSDSSNGGSSAAIRTLDITSNSSSNFTADDALGTTYTFDVTSSGVDVGNYAITSSNGVQNGSNFNTPVFSNGVLTINPLAVSLTSSAVSKIYDGLKTATGASITVSNKIGNDDITVSGISLFSDKNVAIGKTYTTTALSLGGTKASNYYLTASQLDDGITGTGDITQKTITLSGLTVENKTYDRTTNAVISSLGTLNDVIINDAVAINTSASAAFDTIIAGNNKSVTLSNVTLVGADAGNYSFISPTTTTANIYKKALTLTSIELNDRVYNSTTNASTVNSYGSLVGVINGDTINATGGIVSDFSSKNVGSYAISVSGITLNDTTNYVLSNTTLTDNNVAITPKSITLSGVTLNNKVYDGTTSSAIISGYGTFSGIETIDSGKVNAAGGNVATYSSKIVGAYTGINITGVSLTGDEASNYSLSNSNFTANSTITQKSLSVIATASDKTYDGNQTANINLSSADIIAGDAVTLQGSGTFNNSNAANARRVDISGISLGTSGDEGNYSLQNTTYTTYASILQRAITLTTDSATKVYGDSEASLGVSLVTGSTLATGDNLNDVTGTLLRQSGESVGNYDIALGTGSKTSNYNITFTTDNNAYSITQRAITLNANSATKVYGDSEASLGVSLVTGSTLATGDNLNDVTGTLLRQSGESVGNYDIALGTGSKTSNYNITFTTDNNAYLITQRSITLGATNLSKIYGESDPTFAYTVTSGTVVNSDNIGVDLVRATGENVNTTTGYVISNNGTLNSNYNVTFNNGKLTITPRAITLIADAKSKIYGENNPSLTYQIEAQNGNRGLVNEDTFNGELSTNAAQYSNVGNYNVISTLSNSNYDITFVGTNKLGINARAITLTADAKSKIYGENNPNLTYQIEQANGTEGLVNRDTFSGALSTGATQFSNVGSYGITSTLANSNYSINYVGDNLTVGQRAISLTADAKSKIYGENNPNLTYQIEQANGTRGLVNADIFSGNLSTNATQFSNVGTYGITSTLANSNYSINYVGDNLIVRKRALTVSTQNAEKIIGLADPEFVYTVSGLVGNDTKSVLTGILSRENGIAPGDYQILRGTLDSQNYDIVYNSGILKIKALPVVVNVTPPTPPALPEIPRDPSGNINQIGNLSGITNNGNTGSNSLNSGINNSGNTTNLLSSTTVNNSLTTTNSIDTGNNRSGSGINNSENTNNLSLSSIGNTSLNTTSSNDGLNNSNSLSDIQNGSSKNSLQSSSQSGNASPVSQSESKPLTLDGITVGATNNNTSVKAIVIYGAVSSETPVSLMVGVKVNEGFIFKVPDAIVSQAISIPVTKLNNNSTQALLVDGKPLPSWVSFDKNNMSFSSKNVPEGGLPLTVKVTVTNGETIKNIEIVLK